MPRPKSSKILFEDGTYDLAKFRKVFVEQRDPTEYKAAIKLVGSWEAWCDIKDRWPDFEKHIDKWIDEINTILRSEAVELINKQAAKSFQAAKWMAEEGYKKRAGAGRPTKNERIRAAKQIAEMASSTRDEKERVLRLVNGGGDLNG